MTFYFFSSSLILVFRLNPWKGKKLSKILAFGQDQMKIWKCILFLEERMLHCLISI